jgi:HlyD family secretion protein
VIAVPFDAIIERNGKKVVYVIKNNVIIVKEIKTNRGNKLYDIVVSGLKPGEEVVINPAPGLKNGQKVAITRGEA